MDIARTPRLLLVTFIGVGAFASVACGSSGGSSGGSTAGSKAGDMTFAANSEEGDAAAGNTGSQPSEAPTDVISDDGGTSATGDSDAAAPAKDAAPNPNLGVDGGTNLCTSVLDGGPAPNGCLDNGGCQDFMYNLTPNVFAQAATCVGQIPSCMAGNPAIMTCLTTALAGARLDPSTASYCAQISQAETSCTKGTPADAGSMADCDQLLSGFTTAGRESFVKCAAESCADPNVVPDCLTFVMSEAMQ